MESNSYIVEGGIGKHIMFTAMIPALAKRDGRKINVISAYPDVFENHPQVNLYASLDHMHVPEVVDKTEEFIFTEPYKTNFIKGGPKHLLHYWCKELGIKYSEDMLPKMYSTSSEELLNKVTEIKADMGEFILVQFTGGQSPIGYDYDNSQYHINDMIQQRNYQFPFANLLVSKIKARYPDLTIIDYSLPNEHPGYQGAERLDMPFKGYVELLKECKAFIGIDSSLLHMGTAVGAKGIGLYGGIPAWRFGWDQNINLTNFSGSLEGFNPYDPYYISIDSERVLNELDKLLKG